MRHFTRLGILCALLGSLSFATAQAADHCRRGEHMRITGSISGSLDFTLPEGPAWVGYMLIKVGDQPAKYATFIDRGAPEGPTVRPDGSLVGTETITVLLDDGSFQINGKFVGIPETPGMLTLHETGTISDGDGEYEGMTGWVFIKGPFMSPMGNPAMEKGFKPLWLAQLHGHVVKPRK